MLMTASVRSLMRGRNCRKTFGIGRRLAVLGVARVQVQDGRPLPRRADGVLGDLLRRDRQIGRLRRDMDRPGHRAGDDDLSGRGGHSSLLLVGDRVMGHGVLGVRLSHEPISSAADHPHLITLSP